MNNACPPLYWQSLSLHTKFNTNVFKHILTPNRRPKGDDDPPDRKSLEFHKGYELFYREIDDVRNAADVKFPNGYLSSGIFVDVIPYNSEYLAYVTAIIACDSTNAVHDTPIIKNF